MQKREPGWVASVRALASPEPGDHPPQARRPPHPRGWRRTCPPSSSPAPLDAPGSPTSFPKPAPVLTLRESQEAVVKQKAPGRVAALESPGLEAAPAAGPLLILRQRLELRGAGNPRELRRLQGLLRRGRRRRARGRGGQDGDVDGRRRRTDAARGVWAGGDESRVLDAFAALHDPGASSRLPGAAGAGKKKNKTIIIKINKKYTKVPLGLLLRAGGSAPARGESPPPRRPSQGLCLRRRRRRRRRRELPQLAGGRRPRPPVAARAEGVHASRASLSRAPGRPSQGLPGVVTRSLLRELAAADRGRPAPRRCGRPSASPARAERVCMGL